MDVVSSSSVDRLSGRPFGRIDPRREGPALLAVVVSKVLLTCSVFWAYGVLKHLPLAVFLFFLKASASVVYVLLQKPLSSGKRVSRQMWIRISQYSILVAGTGVLWTLGLTLCGPLRTVLLWEHSDLALLSAVGALLTLGTPKGRGALFLMVGILALLLFDNDHSSPPSEHPEGPHRNLVSHTIYWLLSFMGVPDHRGGVALLLCGLCLSVLQKKLGRRLSVDVGGAKRLQALSTLVVAIMLVPWAFIQFFTQEVVEWGSVLPCLLVTSLCQVVDFYTSSVALSKADHCQVARTSSLSSFFSACFIALLLWWYLPSEGTDHALSAGVVIGACLFVLATPSLTRPLDRSGGILIGYSPSGLPLYQEPPSFPHQLRGALVKIMENADSRRIFYFLVLNLVFTFIELIYGMWTNSLGLISDGFHMLFDCTALMMGLYASLMSHWKPTRVYSYGYGRMEVLSGFVNCLFLVVVAVFVFIEALHRLVEPPDISSERLLFVSVAGFVVNLIGLVAFSGHAHSHGGHGHSHGGSHTHSGNANMRGMFLHVLADTMGSVSVIVSSLLIQQFGWLVADPICSLFIAILIMVSVVPLLKDSADALLLATPDHEHVQNTLNKLPSLDGVLGYSDAHFWHQSSDHKTGTIHIQVAPSINEQKVIAMVTTFLKSELGVSNLTLQIEKEDYVQCGLKLSYLKHLALTTPPQVYVDHGPHVGQIKAI